MSKLIPKHQNPSEPLKTDKLTTETTFKDGLKRTSFIIRTPWIKLTNPDFYEYDEADDVIKILGSH